MTGTLNRIAQLGAAALIAATLAAMPTPASAEHEHDHDHGHWREHGWAPPGHWRRYDRDDDRPVVFLDRDAYYAPPPVVVVAPPPRVYAVPAEPSLDLIFPIHIR